MGLTDKLKDLSDKAKDTAAGHKDQVHQAVQKAAQLADQRTGGQYHDQLTKAGDKADAYVDDLKPTEPRHPEAPAGDAPHRPPTPAEEPHCSRHQTSTRAAGDGHPAAVRPHPATASRGANATGGTGARAR